MSKRTMSKSARALRASESECLRRTPRDGASLFQKVTSLRNLLLVPVLFCALAVSAHAARPFQALADLDDLPVLKTGMRTYQVSSHDPTGGNNDWGHFQGASGKMRVLADLKGPGIVRRIWSANPSGRLRVEIDGAERPAVDAPFVNIFQDKVPAFRPPIAGQSSGGWYSYVPMAFTKSCRITVTDGGPFYYQVTWQKLPDAKGLTPFTGTLDADDAADYQAANTAWTHLGENPQKNGSLDLPKRDFRLPPNGRWTQPITGPGTITALRFRFAPGTTFEDLRQTVLRISFDGKVAVESPLGDFFGIGFEGARWKSLPLGVDAEGAYCYFRMPFKKSARIDVENQGKGAVSATFTGAARAGVPSQPWGYFHADYHTAVNEIGQDYIFGRLRGAGHVVGVTESMRGAGSLWFLEGDEKVYVDGEAIPSIYGTGTEDFYNCGWYFNTGLVDGALHGLSHKTDNEIGAWRLTIPDAIPFTRSLDFHIEHGGTNDAPGTEYASVLYWYGAPGAKYVGPPLSKGAALLPRAYIAPVANTMQAETAAWTVSPGGTVQSQAWQAISPYRGGGRTLLKGRPGVTATTPLEVRFTDSYDLDVYLSGANTDSSARLVLDGAPLGQPLRDASGPLPLRKVALGPVTLSEGPHTLGLTIDSGSAIGLDSFRVSPRSPLVSEYAVLGPFSADPEAGVKTPLPPDGKQPRLSETFSASGRTLYWRVMQVAGGVLDLGATLTPNENVVAYASFAVKSPVAQDMPLMLGSDDGVAAWVNGDRVWMNRKTRGFIMDEDRVPIHLNAGWNTVVLKVDQGAAVWSLSARIPDPEGRLQFAAVAPE
jgi:hypothetical protein